MMISKFIPLPLCLLCACSSHPPVQNTAENAQIENNTTISANVEETTNNNQKLEENANTQSNETHAANDQAKVEENAHSQVNIEEDSSFHLANTKTAETESNTAENSNTSISNALANDANDTNDDHAIDENLVQCEVRLDVNGELYTAQATGPTLEEARDNAIDESCSIPCAESIDANLSEDEAEDKIIACAQSCADKAIVIAALCSQSHTVIYSEGAWEHNDTSTLSD